MARGVIVISAPAGTGKTSLLRDVAQVDAGPLERARTWLERSSARGHLGDATHVDGWIAAANRLQPTALVSRTSLCPVANEPDLDDVPEYVRR